MKWATGAFHGLSLAIEVQFEDVSEFLPRGCGVAHAGVNRQKHPHAGELISAIPLFLCRLRFIHNCEHELSVPTLCSHVKLLLSFIFVQIFIMLWGGIVETIVIFVVVILIVFFIFFVIVRAEE